MKKCLNTACGKESYDDAIFCYNCGKRFEKNVVDVNTVYKVTNQVEMYSEECRWKRLNAFLVAETIILVSWTTLFCKASDPPKTLLYLLPILGVVLGFVWAILGRRTSKYHDAIHKAAKEFEEKFLNVPLEMKPYHIVDRIREELQGAKQIFGSNWIVVYVPVLFALVFLLIIALLYRSRISI